MLNTNFKNNNITDVLKVLNQIQEEGWICGLEEISAEMQKRFQLFTITGKEGRPQELHNTTINCLLDLIAAYNRRSKPRTSVSIGEIVD